MNFSLSDLCKRSAAQIFYLRHHPDKVFVSPEQYLGSKKQANASKSKYVEMCGAFNLEKDTIFFSWDEVVVKRKEKKVIFIEHKSVSNDYEDWYLFRSVLQTALYAALTSKTRRFKTASFHVKNKNKELKLDTAGFKLKYRLQFGTSSYNIKLRNTTALIKFLIKKINATKTYNTAKEFDIEYKHKEFEILKNCFYYTLLKK